MNSYFALRSYRDDGEHYDGQLGSEATPTEFVDNLIACTADWLKVLKPTGSLFVNLGDKFAGSGGHNNAGISRHGLGASTLQHDGRPNPRPAVGTRLKVNATLRNAPDRYNQASDGIPAKSRMGLPWRYAIRCIDELGLILRADIVWSKVNGLPESVTDRVRISHEYLFHFTRQGRYFAAIDEVREPAIYPGDDRSQRGPRLRDAGVETQPGWRSHGNTGPNSLGKVPGSVWTLPSEPLTVPAYRIVQSGRHVAYPHTLDEAYKVMRGLGVRNGRPSLRTMADHFAAYPSELVRRIILGWTPTGWCTACGEARRPVVDAHAVKSPVHGDGSIMGNRNGGPDERGWDGLPRFDMARTITGYACACPTADAPTTPAVVLDPFSGTGTTPAVAHLLGRHGIGTDLSADYLRLAEWRCTNDQRLRHKVLDRTGIPNPDPPTIDGQLNLFGGAA